MYKRIVVTYHDNRNPFRFQPLNSTVPSLHWSLWNGEENQWYAVCPEAEVTAALAALHADGLKTKQQAV